MHKIILAIDIQNEYISDGRPFHIKGIKPSLNNALTVIQQARKNGIPVWHMRHEQQKNVFVKNTPQVNFINEFEPEKNEPHFTKDMYSCFSSSEFTKQLAETKPKEIIVIGYGSSMCCMCTIIDGIHRGYQFTLIEDATAARSFPHATEEEMHRSAINILTQYATIKKTNELISELESSNNLESVTNKI